MRKKLMNYLLAVAFVYAGLTAYLYFNQRNMMYFPEDSRPVIQVDVQPETIGVTPEEGITLEGWYWPAKKGFPTLVFFHGNGHAYQYWVDKLTHYRKEGYGALLTDYRGYGGFPGKPTEQGIYRDARSFIQALRETVPFEDMIYYGESLGTGVAVQMATEFRPRALILENSYSATLDVAEGRYWMFPVALMMKDQYHSKDKIGELDIPKYFIHAENDRIVPIRYARKLYAAAPEPKEFKAIPESGHNDLYDHGAQLHILSFLSKITAEE